MTSSGDAPSLRVDPLRGWATIVAPARSKRPFDTESAAGDTLDEAGPGQDPSACPFCPGSEDFLGEILQQLPATEEGDSWGARAVRNLHPFTSAGPSDMPVSAEGPVRGLQEVLIETPRHHAEPADMSNRQIRTVLDLWIARIEASHQEAPDAEVHLFRNRGRDAGSSRKHPHGQLVRMHTPTPGRTGLIGRLKHEFGRTSRCAICASGASEPAAADRTVIETSHYVVRTLWAPLDPGHLRVIPRRHGSTPARVTPAERDDLADVLRRTLSAVRDALGDPDWNLLLHDTGASADPSLHWHIELRPRSSRGAGFEQSAQMGVCGTDPVLDAGLLREKLPPQVDIDRDAEPGPDPENPGASDESLHDPGSP